MFSPLLQYLPQKIINSLKPKHIRKVDIKGDMTEPLMSTQLAMVSAIKRCQAI